jgi:hypothetical protein
MPLRAAPFLPFRRWRFLGELPVDRTRYFDPKTGKKRIGYVEITRELIDKWGPGLRLYPKQGHWFVDARADVYKDVFILVVTGPSMPEVDEGGCYLGTPLEDCLVMRFAYR